MSLNNEFCRAVVAKVQKEVDMAEKSSLNVRSVGDEYWKDMFARLDRVQGMYIVVQEYDNVELFNAVRNMYLRISAIINQASSVLS